MQRKTEFINIRNVSLIILFCLIPLCYNFAVQRTIMRH